MRAWRIGDRRNGAMTLHKLELPDLAPGPGEAVFKVRATGLGARDLRS